jgi:hypothetical protein
MKLRLRAHTIRLRLIQSEVERLSRGEAITETLPTPRPFHYTVAPGEVAELEASFEADTLRIHVPRAWATGWAASSEVGRQAVSGGLDILIEKDWACTTPRSGDDNQGTYPNPTALG